MKHCIFLQELGIAPGGEFRAAFRASKEVPNCQLHLADRPIEVTLKRAFHALSSWQKVKFACSIIFSSESYTQEEIEKCKEQDQLEMLLNEMAGKKSPRP